MINQLLKLGALIATGRFFKQRWRGVLAVLGVWLALWLVHGEFVRYVELSGDVELEADRRKVQERIDRIREELETVRRQRATQRSGRQRSQWPLASIVGVDQIPAPDGPWR